MSISVMLEGDAGFGTMSSAELRHLTPDEMRKVGQRVLSSTLEAVTEPETPEANVPGIDNQRLKLHHLGLVALSSREVDVLKRAGRL